MKVERKDYVVVALGGRKLTGRVLHVGDDEVSVRFIKGQDESYEDTVPVDDVLANMGKKPIPGSVYGAAIRPKFGKDSHEFFGDITYYVDVPESDKTRFLKMLDVAQAALQRAIGDIPPLALTTEVHPRKGKMIGCFKPGEVSTLSVMPTFGETKSEAIHLLAHEYGHGLWSFNMTPVSRLRWVNLFRSNTQIEVVEGDESDQIRDIVVSNGGIRSAISDSTEETAALIKAAVKHIRDVHGLTAAHLNMMVAEGEDLSDVWPTHIEIGTRSVFVTDYARKSPEELWCESLGYSLAGAKIPKKAEALVRKTLTAI